MCLLRVKEEPYYSEPVRVKQVRRVRRSYSPEPIRTARYSNTRVVEERRPASYIPPPEPAPLPPPPAPHTEVPPPPPAPGSLHQSTTKIESRATSRAPSLRQSAVIVESERPPSKRTSRAPSIQSPTQASYVEVSHEPESPGSSISSGDVRSHSTRRTSNTHKSATTRKSSLSASKSPPPVSEYSEHEKIFRRERTYSGGRPRQDYETYQYVNAPPGHGRRSDYGDRRASRGSFGHRSSRELQVRHREYWR